MQGNEVTSVSAVPILGRLFTATLASRDAFAHAAYSVASPAFAALFAECTEEQRRIARYLRTQLLRGASPPGVVTAAALVYASPVVALMPPVHDPGRLLGECLRVLEACMLEFRRAAAGNALTLVQRDSLDCHQVHMRRTSDKLFQLRSEYGTLPPPVRQPEATDQEHALEPAWFVASDDEISWPVAQRSVEPPGGLPDRPT